VELLARNLDMVEVAPGDLRKYVNIDSIPRFVSPGQVAFNAWFADGSKGVMVASVPEPAQVAAAVLIVLGMAARRR
jgi:hypothetical protein